jgi:hypothetical protein
MNVEILNSLYNVCGTISGPHLDMMKRREQAALMQNNSKVGRRMTWWALITNGVFSLYMEVPGSVCARRHAPSRVVVFGAVRANRRRPPPSWRDRSLSLCREAKRVVKIGWADEAARRLADEGRSSAKGCASHFLRALCVDAVVRHRPRSVSLGRRTRVRWGAPSSHMQHGDLRPKIEIDLGKVREDEGVSRAGCSA